ncbi:hypothetical protein [Aquaspirillum soli]
MITGTESVTIKATCLGPQTYTVEWCVDDDEVGIHSVNGIDCDLLSASFIDALTVQLVKDWKERNLESLAENAADEMLLLELV